MNQIIVNNHSVCDIIDELESTNSRIEKENILKANKNNEDLKNVFFYAYHPHINFFIKKIPSYRVSDVSKENLGNALNNIVFEIASRRSTGHAARDFLISVLSELNKSDAEILRRVVTKDMKCGVTATTVNKIWKNLIPQMKVMLASPDTSNITLPAIVQPKLDGLRAHFTRTPQGLSILTRNGKPIDDNGFFFDFLSPLMKVGDTWDGEIVCIDSNGRYLPRQTSNGVLNKAIRGTISEEETAQMRAIIWDITTVKAPYFKRLEILEDQFTQDKFGIFRLIDSTFVNSMEEIELRYQEEIEKKNEGIVVKNPNAFWEGKRSNNLVKIKEILDTDLRVIGWEEGTGRNKGRMGNLILGTDDKKLKVSVGTGFSDKQRDEMTEENTKGKIAAIQYNAVIQSKDSEIYSMFLPRFVEFREDKDETDTLEDLI
jgi:ATP-dependent DNA ligase